MQVSISSKTTPLPPTQNKPPEYDLNGAKTLPSPQSYKNPPLGTKQGVKAPPVRHKVKKNSQMYVSINYVEWKALWSQQIKQFFMEETDCYGIYHLVVTRGKLLNI